MRHCKIYEHSVIKVCDVGIIIIFLRANYYWGQHIEKGASSLKTQQETFLKERRVQRKRREIHLFDRGTVGAPWLQQLAVGRLCFIDSWQAR